MYRRGVVRHVPLMAPDALHLHSLVFRRVAMPIERRHGEREPSARANARVAPRLWLHSALCFALAVLFHDNTPALWLGLAAYTAFYVHRYRELVLFRAQAPAAARPAAPRGRRGSSAPTSCDPGLQDMNA